MHGWITKYPILLKFSFDMNSMKRVIPLHFTSCRKDFQQCCKITIPWPIYIKIKDRHRSAVYFQLWCELTSTMNVTEWHVSWNSYQIYSNFKTTDLLEVLDDQTTHLVAKDLSSKLRGRGLNRRTKNGCLGHAQSICKLSNNTSTV